MNILGGYIQIGIKIAVTIFMLFILPLLSFLFFSAFGRMRKSFFFGFGSGVILSAVFLRVLPDILTEMKESIVSILMFGGIAISIVLDKVVFFQKKHISPEGFACWYCEEPQRLSVILGFSAHYIVDGFFLGGLALSSPNFTAVLLPIVAHKLVDGLILSLIFSGTKRGMLYVLMLCSFNMLGLSLFLFGGEYYNLIHLVSPIAAGILIYVAIHDFIPVVDTLQDFMFFFAGAGITYAILEFSHIH